MSSPNETFVDDVRAARAKFCADHDHDLDRIFEALKKAEQEHPERVVIRRKHVTYTVEPAYPPPE
jgi:hypothetical protein